MKKLLLLAVVIFGLFGGQDVVVAQEKGVKKAPDHCKNAHAILGWSDFKKIKGKHGKDKDGNWIDETDEEFQERIQKPWVKVGWIVGRLNWGRAAGNEQLKMVDSYEAGVYGQAEFKEYRVKGHDNAKAYVAHCGHGGTCNMIAERFYNLYKGIGVPQVICGENAMPPVAVNPAKPTIPLPTEEELAEAEDDDYSFGDDDDDDDDKKDDDPSVDDF